MNKYQFGGEDDLHSSGFFNKLATYLGTDQSYLPQEGLEDDVDEPLEDQDGERAYSDEDYTDLMERYDDLSSQYEKLKYGQTPDFNDSFLDFLFSDTSNDPLVFSDDDLYNAVNSQPNYPVRDPYSRPASTLDPDRYLNAIYGNEGGRTGVDPRNVRGTASGRFGLTKAARLDVYNKHFKNQMTYSQFNSKYNRDANFEYEVARKLAEDKINSSETVAEAIGSWYSPKHARSGQWGTVPFPSYGNRLTMQQYVDKALGNYQFGGKVAETEEELYEGLNNEEFNEMILNLPPQYNLIRGLDNFQPVRVMDEAGNEDILTGPKDTAQMFGRVYEEKMRNGGSVSEVPKAQVGRQNKPIYTSDKNDPRLRAYNDSLASYNSGLRQKAEFLDFHKRAKADKAPIKPLGHRFDETNLLQEPFIAGNYVNGKLVGRPTNILPINAYAEQFTGKGKTIGWLGINSYREFKKPVQPVVYKEQQSSNNFVKSYNKKYPPIYVDDPNDPRLKAYQDSLNVYNKGIKDLKDRGSDNLVNTFDPNDPLLDPLKSSWRGNVMPISIEQYDRGYSGRGTAFIPRYKKPVQPVIYQPEPKLKRVNNPRFQSPDLGTGAAPSVQAPDLQQANYDFRKPTKYSFTYPTGQYNQQKSIYLPDIDTLRAFSEPYGAMISEYGKDEAHALTHRNIEKLQSGGAVMPNLGSPYEVMRDKDTALYSLQNAKDINIKKSGKFTALISPDFWTYDMMNYIDKFKMVKNRDGRFFKIKGNINKYTVDTTRDKLIDNTL